MTSLETGQLTGTETLRFTVRLPARVDPPSPSLLDVSHVLNNLDSFFTAATLAAIAPDQSDSILSESDWRDRHKDRIGSALALSQRSLVLQRISYNSPLEVWFAVGGGAAVTGVALSYLKVASKVIGIYEEYQRVRLVKSNTDLEIARNNVILEELNLRKQKMITRTKRRGMKYQVPSYTLNNGPKDSLDKLVDGAGRGVESIERLRVERD